MRGSQTPENKKEEAKTLVATTNNKSAVSRILNIPRETIRDIVLNDDEFAEFRHQVQKEYIIKTWANILDIETALAKKIKDDNIEYLGLREITGAIKDLKQTMENIYATINNQYINDNHRVVYSGTSEQNQAIDEFVIQRYKELMSEGKVDNNEKTVV